MLCLLGHYGFSSAYERMHTRSELFTMTPVIYILSLLCASGAQHCPTDFPSLGKVYTNYYLYTNKAQHAQMTRGSKLIKFYCRTQLLSEDTL